ncbi:hypothetical protein JAAARDRAFT_27950 [Jaapia argillacea MUCL 33604]|uniref:Enoyl reductase (ER) domain-containing protein n=1 Tax=Jaapia argillacea MUCL 33604 TaxID=933084 RepID=A0A067QBG4_9AGAM|nr:hypothetical protein JAAARDRAFT_27950 [Jaapia argillacea MUCL 33604]
MSTQPKTYKAAVVTKAHAPFELLDIPWKDPQQGQVVVKVLACGVCHSDHAVVSQGMPTGLPRIPGHEIIGDIVQVGAQEKKWKVGDRVGSGWFGGHCFTCENCRRGDFSMCDNAVINGIFIDGGYAEYVTLRSEALAAIPEGLDPVMAAPFLCAGVTTFNSIRNMGLSPGDIVGVQGIGGLGHLAIQYCRAMGFHTVALSSSPSKQKLAAELGAHDYLDGSKVNQGEALQKLGGAKLILATAPSPKVIETLINGLAVGGKLCIVAIVPEPLSVPTIPLIMKRLSIVGWPSGTARDSQDCLEFSKLANVKCHVVPYPLSKANEAFAAMSDGSAKFRAVLVP